MDGQIYISSTLNQCSFYCIAASIFYLFYLYFIYIYLYFIYLYFIFYCFGDGSRSDV
jgi:Trk-type K+ transport system membrane component